MFLRLALTRRPIKCASREALIPDHAGTIAGRFVLATGGVGITAIAVYALLQHGLPVDHPAVRSGLTFIERHIQPDGGIYSPDSFYKNYETCIAIMCFQAANKDGRYKEIIGKAERFVKDIQVGRK